MFLLKTKQQKDQIFPDFSNFLAQDAITDQISNKVVNVVSKDIKNEFQNLNPIQQELMKEIALNIGIDFNKEHQNLEWFMNLMNNTQLPIQWIQIQNENIIEFKNIITGEITHTHPNLELFRISYHESVLQIEKNKKMPVIQQRKQFAKKTINLLNQKQDSIMMSKNQQSQQGSTMLSKILKQKKQKNFDNQLSQISSINSSIESKIPIKLTKQITQDIKLNADVFADAIIDLEKIQSTKNDKEIIQDQQIIDVDNIIDFDIIMEQANDYYWKTNGFDINQIQEQSQKLDLYRINPLNMIDSMHLFNISPEDTHLYWIALLYHAIPLPPSWKCENKNRNGQYYTNGEYKIYVRPCYTYINDLLRFLKYQSNYSPSESIIQKQNKQYIVRFEDSLYRDFEVDIKELYEQKFPSSSQITCNQESTNIVRDIEIFKILKELDMEIDKQNVNCLSIIKSNFKFQQI